MSFYDVGPWQVPEDCMPATCWRVQVQTQDGAVRVAVCIEGRWWCSETRSAEEPVRWRHMLDYRMTV